MERILETRLARLAERSQRTYWVAKIQTNVARDQKQTAALEAAGWIFSGSGKAR